MTKEKMLIKTWSPNGSCTEVKKIFLDIKENNLEYTCPKCKNKNDYYNEFFNHEPYGKSLMSEAKRYPIVKHECKKCHHVDTIFTMVELNEDHIVVEDGSFSLKVINNRD